MANTAQTPRSKNALLSQLSSEEFENLQPHLTLIDLPIRLGIFEPNQPIRHAYFPEAGMISVVSNMENGASIEVGTIGHEGIAGARVLMGADSIPYQAFVQLEGQAHRIAVESLQQVAGQNPHLKSLILRFQSAFLTQSMQCAACNGLHSIQQRCCRWLLMSRDCCESDELSLTHEFLGLMLGVRRASVTDVLQPLSEAGLLASVRGKITILDRSGLQARSCECYRIIAERQRQLLLS
jgi:CRP-like cAMP-binding protein